LYTPQRAALSADLPADRRNLAYTDRHSILSEIADGILGWLYVLSFALFH
jgi:hypothetical protein